MSTLAVEVACGVDRTAVLLAIQQCEAPGALAAGRGSGAALAVATLRALGPPISEPPALDAALAGTGTSAAARQRSVLAAESALVLLPAVREPGLGTALNAGVDGSALRVAPTGDRRVAASATQAGRAPWSCSQILAVSSLFDPAELPTAPERCAGDAEQDHGNDPTPSAAGDAATLSHWNGATSHMATSRTPQRPVVAHKAGARQGPPNGKRLGRACGS